MKRNPEDKPTPNDLGKPFPVPTKETDDVFGYMSSKVKIVGDIVSPITPASDWQHD